MPPPKTRRRSPRASADPDEPEVRMHDPMPKGYTFVPKGNVYITKNCRTKTHEAEKPLYVVLGAKDKPIGLRCPTYIYKSVVSQEKATAPQRAEAVQKRDAAIEENFEEAIVKLFPEIPRAEIPLILKESLKKNSGRVGRTGTVALHDRVKLAVHAHIRHAHTDYDRLLRQGESRDRAREVVWEEVSKVARLWGGRPLKPAPVEPAIETATTKSTAKSPPPKKEKKKSRCVTMKAAVGTARRITRRMVTEASSVQAKSAQAGLGTRTRGTASGPLLSEADDDLTERQRRLDRLRRGRHGRHGRW